jgi:Flp pilus assembly protein TadG
VRPVGFETVGAGNSIAARRARHRERGFVLITMAMAAVALFAVLGLAVDVGRMFITKNETQAYCDSAALAAALALDGTTTGITNAQAAVANSINHWNLGNTSVSSPTTVFATALAGSWDANPSPAAGYIYARVTATATMNLYFLPIVVSKTTQDVTSTATAGQIDITTLPRGLAPYTAVSTNRTGPNFGFVIGNSYDLQWPAENACKVTDAAYPNNCFVRPPCSGETDLSKRAVAANWSSSESGYWGSSSNSVIEKEILNVIQTGPVGVGLNITLANGNKASEAGYLDQRATQDLNTTDNVVSAYLASTHNGRRLVPVPFVDPIDKTRTEVIGFGQFLLLANGPGTSNYYVKNTTGNDPYCAIYAGSFNIGSIGPGAGGSTGASWVKLVQ